LGARCGLRFTLGEKKSPAMNAGPLKSRLLIYTLKDEPQPQVLFTFGFSNLKPAPSRLST